MANAGTKSGGIAWAIALGTVVVALGVSFLGGKIPLPGSVQYGLYVAIFGAGGALAVYLSRGGAGGGIVAFLVASLLMAVGCYVLTTMAVSALAAAPITGTGPNDTGSIQLNAGAANAIGAIAGVFIAFLSFLVSFGASLTGCLIGNSMKKKALAASAPASAQRLAA